MARLLGGRSLVDVREELPEEIESRDLLQRGWEWLDGNEDNPEWNYGWQKLVDVRKELPGEIESRDLLQRGWEWLDGNEDRGGNCRHLSTATSTQTPSVQVSAKVR